MCQAAEAETKKYEKAQQSEQSAFQASIADLEHAVASMQSYTDMSAATTVAEEVSITCDANLCLHLCGADWLRSPQSSLSGGSPSVIALCADSSHHITSQQKLTSPH